MVDLIGSVTWDLYKNIINSGHETFNQDSITWLRSNGGLDRNGEDNLNENFTSIVLKGLFDYNYFRKWATNQTTETGELDRQNEVILLNIKYLKDLGYMNSAGYFNFDQSSDRFIHKGIKYKSVGSTLVSQAQTEPLLFMVILQREEIQTGFTSESLPITLNNCTTEFGFTNQLTITCNHNKARHVEVTIYNLAGEEIEGQVYENTSTFNQVIITFNQAQSGVIVVD